MCSLYYWRKRKKDPQKKWQNDMSSSCLKQGCLKLSRSLRTTYLILSIDHVTRVKKMFSNMKHKVISLKHFQDVLRRIQELWQEQYLSEFVIKLKAFEMKLLKFVKRCVLSDVRSPGSSTTDNGKQTVEVLSQKKGNHCENKRVRERTINTVKRSRWVWDYLPSLREWPLLYI